MADAQYTEDQREASPRWRELVVQANYSLACAIASDPHEAPQLRTVAMRQCAMTR